MSWKVRAAAVGIAWIVIPWTWAIAEEQARRRRRDPPEEEGASPG
jgi:hypothetical protein